MRTMSYAATQATEILLFVDEKGTVTAKDVFKEFKLDNIADAREELKRLASQGLFDKKHIRHESKDVISETTFSITTWGAKQARISRRNMNRSRRKFASINPHPLHKR